MRVLTLTGAALLLVVAACGADKASHVQQNERILEILPEATGAERLEVEHNPYYEDWGGPPIGWTTNVIYGAPPGLSARDVVDFYVLSLEDEWEFCLEEVPGVDIGTGELKASILLAHFTEGGAMVSVNTDNMYEGGPHMFEVVVDHDTRTNPCTGEDLR